jgi:beta-glucuronidase
MEARGASVAGARVLVFAASLALLAGWVPAAYAPARAAADGPARAAAYGPARATAYAPSPPTQGALYTDGQTGRYLLRGTWLYRADPTDSGIAAGWWRDTAAGGWARIQVPRSDNAGDFSTAGMDGTVGWYRRDFTLPTGAFAHYVPAPARRWIVRFESVNYVATVWLNGHRLGRHTGANLPFEFDLSNLRRGVNRLVVRVDNRIFPGELPPGPGGGWWNYGGILREVYLRRVQAVDIAAAQIRPLLHCPAPGPATGRCRATVDEDVVVRNLTGASQAVQLNGRYGTAAMKFGQVKIPPHGTWTAHASVPIAHPDLWAPGHPHLYTATLTLADNKGQALAGYTALSGIRSIKVNSDGRLTLNGRLVHLRGVEIREQDLRLGAALDPSDLRRLIDWTRALDATLIRSDAPNPELEEMADRDGLLMWLDIPVNDTVTDRYLAMPGWLARAHDELRGNILANQNHPSVLAWSIGNELPTPTTDNEIAYIAGAVALAHRLDPTRPVGMAIADWPGVDCQPAYAPLDVIGLNEYFGWYDAGGGTTDDRDELSPFLDSLHACYPTQALLVTEFGFEANRNGPIDERGTYAFQANAAAYHLAAFNSKPWLSGAIYFLLQDAVLRPDFTGGNPWPLPPFLEKGLLDFYGHRKPAWNVVSASYHRTVQIAR